MTERYEKIEAAEKEISSILQDLADDIGEDVTDIHLTNKGSPDCPYPVAITTEE